MDESSNISWVLRSTPYTGASDLQKKFTKQLYCGSIAAVKQKPIEAATTTSCGWLNPRNSEEIIDFVT